MIGRLAAVVCALVLVVMPRGAQAEATPMFTLTQSLAIDAVRGTAQEGLKYVSPWLYGGAKAVDAALEGGLAAVEEEDRSLGEQMVRAEELDRRLKAMKAAGISTRNSPEAALIKIQLGEFARTMASGKDGIGYAGYAVRKHPGYALFKASLGFALDEGLGDLQEVIGLNTVIKRLPMGIALRDLLERRSPFKRFMQQRLGWTLIGTRAEGARAINDKLVAELVKSIANKIVSGLLNEYEAQTRHDVWAERYTALHRKALTYTGRLDLARALLPAPPPPIMVAAPSAMRAPPEAQVIKPTAQIVARFDPVGQVVSSENLLVPPRAEPVMRQAPPDEPVMYQAPPDEPVIRSTDSKGPNIDVDRYFRNSSFSGNSNGLWGGF